jgi:hypothetical protein
MSGAGSMVQAVQCLPSKHESLSSSPSSENNNNNNNNNNKIKHLEIFLKFCLELLSFSEAFL